MPSANARERILGRLRAAAPGADQSARTPAISRRIDAHFEQRRAAATASHHAAYIDVMQRALEAAHAEVWRSDEAAWPALLAERMRAEGVRRLLVGGHGMEATLLRRGLPPAIDCIAYDKPLEQWKAELFGTVDAGFTVARSGIAATGTLVVVPDASSPRTVSLVPPLHVCLVYADTLHADLHAALHAERWQAGMPTNLVLISGPSKTTDIQLTLAYGAHGPRRLWVVIVDRGNVAQQDGEKQ